ncbi:MAG TPA: DUF1835 domain-containing protein [Gemmatimonadaceae bacterium]|nr:DUF1835 domain-containing protein [Gemmatimonadaceae bacterium]
MSQRLNITNGDSAAGTLSEAGIEGKIIPWRDVLHEGPVDSSLSLEELSKERAAFIAEQGWDDFAHVSGNFVERDRVIRHLDYFDEVVLWFEDDLYDQLQLIQLLDFFARVAAHGKTLSVIVVDGYIPPLSPAQLKKLDETRPRVTQQQLDLAKRAWRAFGSADPTSISKLLAENTSAIRYLASALTRHLEEFPSSVNGLSRSEREALTAIQAGHTTPVAAFLEAATKQDSIFLGDIVFYSYLERLSGKKDALVTWKDGTPVIAPTSERAREFVEGQLVLTPLGRDVLAGNKDWQRIHKKTRWLGGVEISPGEGGWRWDPSEREIVRGESVAQEEKPRSSPRSAAPAKRKLRPATKLRAAKKPRPATKPRPAKKTRPAKKSKSRSAARRAPRKKK